jgi:hypothetical protein
MKVSDKVSDTGHGRGIQCFCQTGMAVLQAVKIGKKLSGFGEDAPHEQQALGARRLEGWL